MLQERALSRKARTSPPSPPRHKGARSHLLGRLGPQQPVQHTPACGHQMGYAIDEGQHGQQGLRRGRQPLQHLLPEGGQAGQAQRGEREVACGW